MRVVVGTKNPSKLVAVRGAIEKLFPVSETANTAGQTVTRIRVHAATGEVLKTVAEPDCGAAPAHEIIGVEVPSGVNAQPMTAAETLRGAKNRANSCLSLFPDSDFAFGIEGGIELLDDEDDAGAAFTRYMESGYIYVIRAADKKTAVGTSARFEIAPHVMSRLQAGEELSDVMDDLADVLDIRSTQGMMGLVTNGQLHRGACYEHGVLFALAPFVSPQQYWDQAAADRVSKKAQAQAAIEAQAQAQAQA